jgi:RES domain-containing protein|tara:strand:- start:7589 stop:8050 length:462 start_codon:yes stop_codon:yes gene_type:complete
MIVYRISKGKYKNDLSGTGAQLHGGRWNNKGNKMLYTASSRALAMAEVAVHVPYGILPKDYFLIEIEVPDLDMNIITLKDLAGIDWASHPPSAETQKIGDDFLIENKNLILQVPSVVVLGDTNILLNPLHIKHADVVVLDSSPFDFDGRLFGV